MERAFAIYLADIIEAIALLRAELEGVALTSFMTDQRQRWLVERGVEIVSEASRRIPDEIKVRHPGIPWPMIAAIGNVLRHEYRRSSPKILWDTVRDDLPELDRICRDELPAAVARDQQPPS